MFIFILIFFFQHFSNFISCEKSEIVFPKIIPHSEIDQRFKRSNDYNSDETFYIKIKNLTLETKYNRDLVVAGDYAVQWASSKGRNKPKIDQSHSQLERCLPLHGEVQGVTDSAVAITICSNHFYGLLDFGNKFFFLQPTKINGSHVMYETKDSSLKDMKDKYNETVKSHFTKFEDNEIDDNPSCSAWQMDTSGSKFVNLGSSSCPGNFNYFRNRTKRSSKFIKIEQPYREVKGCGKRRKRAVTICDNGENFDMAGDVAGAEYFDILDSQYRLVDDSGSSHPRTWYDEEKARPFLKGRIMNRRASDVSKWIKIVIGVDYDVIEFHGDLTQQYVFTILNIVSSLFRKISIINITKIVIKKLIMYPNPEDSAVRKGNMEYPLYNVNLWNRVVYDEAKEKHDMGLWYTHYPLGADVASAPGPYMCNKMRSCILVQDVGWVSAIKIAHGIGHLVGLNHDGEIETNNYCASEALLHATVMSKMIPAVNPAPMWSSCSVTQYNEFIGQFQCLDRPPWADDSTAYLPGIFSLDDQCRIEFGEGWVFCIRVTLKDPCTELWCNRAASRRRSCMTRMTQTLEGTPCGRGKRCINGTCTDPLWDLGAFDQDYTSAPQSTTYSYTVTPTLPATTYDQYLPETTPPYRPPTYPMTPHPGYPSTPRPDYPRPPGYPSGPRPPGYSTSSRPLGYPSPPRPPGYPTSPRPGYPSTLRPTYGTTPGYGQSPPGYGSTSGYGPSPPGYGPTPGYGQSPPGYGPTPGYAQSQPSYGSTPGYVPSPPEYASSPVYDSSQPGHSSTIDYGQSPSSYGPTPGYGSSPSEYSSTSSYSSTQISGQSTPAIGPPAPNYGSTQDYTSTPAGYGYGQSPGSYGQGPGYSSDHGWGTHNSLFPISHPISRWNGWK